MKEELKLIIQLQEIDSAIVQKRIETERLPEEIRRHRRPLEEAERAYAKVKQRHDSLEKKRKEKELELKEINDRIERLKARTSEIKTNKEYQAHLKEIESVEKEKYLVEDDILYMMEEQEEVSGALKAALTQIEEEKGRLQSIQKELDARGAAIGRELEELKQRRAVLVRMIPADLYDRYMDVLQKSNGLAVVEARDEVCLGCNMSIPPQLYVEIKTADGLIQCPQCGRFLYRKE